MKKLATINQVAHHWANRVGDNGAASSLSFQGDTLYSYAAPIATLLPDGTAVLAKRGWSVTTSAHQSLARSAVNYSTKVYCYEIGPVPQNMRIVRDDIARTLQRAEAVLTKVKKDGTPTVYAQRQHERMKAEALHLADEANAYLAAYQRNGLNLDLLPIDTSKLDDVRAELERQQAEGQRRREEAQRQRAAELVEDVAAWRRGETVYKSLRDAPVALRLHPAAPANVAGHIDQLRVIQTSHGAEIPVEDAKRLWPIVLRVRAAGVEWTPAGPGSERRLGVYTLNVIRADGSIKVGCHEIAFSELERMAGELGLREPVAA